MYCKAQSHNTTTAVKPNRSISVQLFDWSMTARKIAVITAKRMSKTQKTVLEITAASLDAC